MTREKKATMRPAEKVDWEVTMKIGREYTNRGGTHNKQLSFKSLPDQFEFVGSYVADVLCRFNGQHNHVRLTMASCQPFL